MRKKNKKECKRLKMKSKFKKKKTTKNCWKKNLVKLWRLTRIK